MTSSDLRVRCAALMGYHVEKDGPNPDFPWRLHTPTYVNHLGWVNEASAWHPLPLYESSMDDAMHLIERMRERGFKFHLSDDTVDGLYACIFLDGNSPASFQATDPSPARAVCLAFVAAMEKEGGEA